ncbi:MAG: domain protein putative component of TonB system [Myxococcaceae bacterium]|nr:domain protein putative component of TonB system [Myxococcaceae bacterium]
MRRLADALLCLSLALCCERAYAAPAVGKAPQKEHRLEPRKKTERSEVPATEQRRSAQQPSNRLEALHYFRDRRDAPAEARSPTDQALLDGLIAQRERASVERRDEAVALLERFIAETPEEASELPDALLRLSELTWESARASYLLAFDAWQKAPESQRAKDPPLPDYARTLALYDRMIEKHADYARLDLVLYMRAFALLERGENDEATPLFRRILADYPRSRFVPDAHMALAEDVFNTNYDYKAALLEYDQVLTYPDSELYDLALFKSAWCLWQLDRKAEAATRFRKVLDLEGARAEGSRQKHLKELQTEALEYLIQVFTEDERNRAADVRRFLQEIGGERHVERVLTRLSATYFDQARFDRGIEAYQLLLELDPKHQRAPQYQLAIARGYVAIDQFPKALVAYQTLAKQYDASGTWAAQQADSDTVDEARAMIERALREQALSLHEIGQRDGQKPQLERAVAMYRVYLEAFPKEPESYRLTFYLGEILFHRLKQYPEAGEVYLTAAQLNPKGEFTRDALYNAIGSFEQVREHEIKQCSESAPCPETANDKRFSRAIELYASYYPNDPDLPEILFRQGKLYYDRRIYDPAVRLFGQLLERFPQSPFAADAGELVLDSFNRAADYENIELWSRKLKTAPAFKTADAQKRLDGLILGAVFKSGEQLAEKGEHQRAADAYLRAAAEFPRDPRAPKALYNAGLELSRAGSLDGADRAYSELIAKYPGSSEGAEGAWKGAEMYESIAQFRDAARFYEAYAERFPRADKTEVASYNAVLLLASAGAQRDAVKAGKRYLAAHPRGEEAAAVTFLIGRAQEADGQTRDAAATYRAFIDRTHDVDRRIEASTRLGLLLLKAGDKKGADAALNAAVADGRNKREKPRAGRYFAAQARFIQGDEALREFDAVKIEGNLQGLSARLKLKAKLLGAAAAVYGDVVEFGVAEWVTAALYKIGESYEKFAKALNDAPLPEGLSEQEQQVYRDELSSFVVPIEERALEAYAGGYKKARELGIYNGWTRSMREALTRMNDVEYPVLKEIGFGLAQETELPRPPVIQGRRRAAKVVTP